MESPININRLEGLRGWLILFQARMAACVVFLLAIRPDAMPAILLILAAALCMLLFYMRCRVFRAAYVLTAALSLAMGIAALPDSALFLAALAVMEATIIPALFISRRVKNTFYTCAKAAKVRCERGAAYERCRDAGLARLHRIR